MKCVICGEEVTGNHINTCSEKCYFKYWYAKNKEKHNQKRRENYKQNIEERRKKAREYYNIHKEEIKARELKREVQNGKNR